MGGEHVRNLTASASSHFKSTCSGADTRGWDLFRSASPPKPLAKYYGSTLLGVSVDDDINIRLGLIVPDARQRAQHAFSSVPCTVPVSPVPPHTLSSAHSTRALRKDSQYASLDFDDKSGVSVPRFRV